jgi:GMP reductase
MKYLDYKDVCLVPRHSNLSSRSLADTSVNFLGRTFKLPIISANMLDVIDEKIAYKLSENDYFYIMHRWFDRDDKNFNANCIKDFISKALISKWKTISISIGVNDVDIIMLESMIKQNFIPNFITIDVANADHENVKKPIKFIKGYFPNTKLIVGNVATADACEYLIKLGADAIKSGIGSGIICSTANKTGFHIPMFSCCLQCAPVCEKYKIPFIADGGISEFGDIAKALTAGATMVMSGKLFAECIDSPAKIVDGYKQYRGSTSFEIKGKNSHIEGRKIEIKNSVTDRKSVV